MIEPGRLAAVLRRWWGLTAEALRPVSGGASTLNLVAADDPEWVATIFPPGADDRAEGQARVLRHLERHGVITNRLLPAIDGAGTASVDGHPFLVKTWLRGRVLDRLDEPALHSTGAAPGRLHRTPPPHGLTRSPFRGLTLVSAVAPHRLEDPLLRTLLGRLSDLRAGLDGRFERGLTHGDLFAENVVLVGDDARIIDLEDVADAPRVADLGMSLLGLCTRAGAADEPAGRAFLRGYSTVASTTTAERAALRRWTGVAIVATAIWRWWERNLLHPAAPRARPPQELVPVLDSWLEADPGGWFDRPPQPDRSRPL